MPVITTAVVGKAIAGAAAKKAAKSKWGKVVIVTAIALPFALLFGIVGVGVVGLQVFANAFAKDCPTVTAVIDLNAVPAGPIEGYDHDQLVIAAKIMNAGFAMGLTKSAQQIGVMTAMGESSLGNPDHGDAVDNTTIGTFQQGESYGPREDRLDTTKAATAFFTRLLGVAGWETMEPTLAAHAVQINLDPQHYAEFFVPAGKVIDALGGTAASGGECGGVPADAQALAKELMAAVDAGKLRGSTPDHIQEIRWIAEGQDIVNCGVDVRILQILVVAVRNFDQVGLSDINRKCTEQIEGAGIYSSHYINGGGHALDLYLLNGSSLTGADANSMKLISLLDPLMPTGAQLGQRYCRIEAGNEPVFQNFSDFADTCNHFHIDVGHTDEPMKF